MNQTWGGAPGALLPYLCYLASIQEGNHSVSVILST